MPSKNQHIKMAGLNEQFGEEVLSLEKRFNSWAVVAFFYSALHWVDAYLATLGYHPPRHVERNDRLRRESILRKIRSDYRHLKTDSVDARYNIRSFRDSEIQLVRGYLETIKAHIQGKL